MNVKDLPGLALDSVKLLSDSVVAGRKRILADYWLLSWP